MKEGLLGDTLRRVIEERAQGGPFSGCTLDWISDVGGLDVCLLSGNGESIAEFAAPADADGLCRLARRVRGQRVRAVIESMNGARFVHVMYGWVFGHGAAYDLVAPPEAPAGVPGAGSAPRGLV